MGIPDAILVKNGKLTDEEFEAIKNHTTAGAEILKISMGLAHDSQFLENAYTMARYHHEKWNGKGYSEGLKGEQIPFIARLISIADVYDALRADRPYKNSFSHEKACEIIKEESGVSFDPDLVQLFLKVNKELDRLCTYFYQNGINADKISTLPKIVQKAFNRETAS